MVWAIASGIEGNLAAYEAVLADINRQNVEEFFILGDVVGPTAESEAVVDRIRNPKSSEHISAVCQGWWEEQCLILHALGRTGHPTQLIDKFGNQMVKTLWDSVSRETVAWIQGLDFGLVELDCLLIHGSSMGADDELTPETPPIDLLDRLSRGDVNHLFCGRSGLAFDLEITAGSVTTSVQTLHQTSAPEVVTITPKKVVGVGNVGRSPGLATYTLYVPGSNQVKFRSVSYGVKKGFGKR
jgi:hypothetical protein